MRLAVWKPAQGEGDAPAFQRLLGADEGLSLSERLVNVSKCQRSAMHTGSKGSPHLNPAPTPSETSPIDPGARQREENADFTPGTGAGGHIRGADARVRVVTIRCESARPLTYGGLSLGLIVAAATASFISGAPRDDRNL